jgi:hypothetical protein
MWGYIFIVINLSSYYKNIYGYNYSPSLSASRKASGKPGAFLVTGSAEREVEG